MKVSVVIPVYNVKPFLERAVQSVLRQSYQDFEIVMVDDGSSDGSGDLAERLKGLWPRTIVVHQENQGLSGARNTGIRHASGEYIVFLDSDDEWLLPDGLERLMVSAREDLIVFKPVDVWREGRQEHTKDYDVDYISTLPDAQAIFSHLIRTGQFRMSACMLLVRRQILTEHGLFFPMGYISEDVNWSLQVWQHAKTVKIQNIDFYGYFHREGSITSSPGLKLRIYDSYNKIFSYWEQQCDEGCVNAAPIRAYMANLWVNMGYVYHKLLRKDRPVALGVMKRYRGFLAYGWSSKAKRVRLLVRLLGVRRTLVVLGWYWKLRTKIKRI